MKLTGTIQKRDLEGGVFVLAADDGKVYSLSGGDRGLKKPGARVEVEGQVDSNAVGIAMAGPVFKVTSYKAI
jgi:hypothetical protein